MTMHLTILGSGSPEAYVRRASSGYLIEAGTDRILFDCGGGVFDNLLRSGRLPRDITHIVFSHLHTDHMMDYARLIHAAWDEGGAPVKVYGPTPIAAITEGYFGPNGVLSHDLRARTELKPSQDVWVARGGTFSKPGTPEPWPPATGWPGAVTSCPEPPQATNWRAPASRTPSAITAAQRSRVCQSHQLGSVQRASLASSQAKMLGSSA